MKRYLAVAAILGVVAALGFSLNGQAADAGAAWGKTLKGQVVLVGDIPAPKKIDVTKDEKHCLENGAKYDETWVVNKDNKGVRWTFVWLAKLGEDGKPVAPPIHADLKQPKEQAAVIDQPCCAFEPHCVALRAGQDLLVKNSAPIAHNVNWAGISGQGGNVLIPPKGQFVIKKLEAERLPLAVKCDIHGWMSARVGVFSHPYFAVTDQDGKFEMKLPPAGDYQLVTYHETGWGPGLKNGQKITIKANDDTDVKVELPVK